MANNQSKFLNESDLITNVITPTSNHPPRDGKENVDTNNMPTNALVLWEPGISQTPVPEPISFNDIENGYNIPQDQNPGLTPQSPESYVESVNPRTLLNIMSPPEMQRIGGPYLSGNATQSEGALQIGIQPKKVHWFQEDPNQGQQTAPDMVGSENVPDSIAGQLLAPGTEPAEPINSRHSELKNGGWAVQLKAGKDFENPVPADGDERVVQRHSAPQPMGTLQNTGMISKEESVSRKETPGTMNDNNIPVGILYAPRIIEYELPNGDIIEAKMINLRQRKPEEFMSRNEVLNQHWEEYQSPWLCWACEKNHKKYANCNDYEYGDGGYQQQQREDNPSMTLNIGGQFDGNDEIINVERTVEGIETEWSCNQDQSINPGKKRSGSQSQEELNPSKRLTTSDNKPYPEKFMGTDETGRREDSYEMRKIKAAYSDYYSSYNTKIASKNNERVFAEDIKYLFNPKKETMNSLEWSAPLEKTEVWIHTNINSIEMILRSLPNGRRLIQQILPISGRLIYKSIKIKDRITPEILAVEDAPIDRGNHEGLYDNLDIIIIDHSTRPTPRNPVENLFGANRWQHRYVTSNTNPSHNPNPEAKLNTMSLQQRDDPLYLHPSRLAQNNLQDWSCPMEENMEGNTLELPENLLIYPPTLNTITNNEDTSSSSSEEFQRRIPHLGSMDPERLRSLMQDMHDTSSSNNYNTSSSSSNLNSTSSSSQDKSPQWGEAATIKTPNHLQEDFQRIKSISLNIPRHITSSQNPAQMRGNEQFGLPAGANPLGYPNQVHNPMIGGTRKKVLPDDNFLQQNTMPANTLNDKNDNNSRPMAGLGTGLLNQKATIIGNNGLYDDEQRHAQKILQFANTKLPLDMSKLQSNTLPPTQKEGMHPTGYNFGRYAEEMEKTQYLKTPPEESLQQDDIWQKIRNQVPDINEDITKTKTNPSNDKQPNRNKHNPEHERGKHHQKHNEERKTQDGSNRQSGNNIFLNNSNTATNDILNLENLRIPRDKERPQFTVADLITDLPRPKELDRFMSSDPIAHSKMDELRNRYDTHYGQRETQMIMTNAWAEKGHDDPNFKAAITALRNTDKQLRNIISQLYEMHNRQTHDESEDYLEMPKFGTDDKVNLTHIQALPAFHPNNSEITLYQFWQKLMQFVSTQGISESGTKLILSQRLFGAAFDIFEMNQENPVRTIVKQLRDRFGSFPTKADYEDKLTNFDRLPNESLRAAMNRFEHIIRKLYKKEKDIAQIVERKCKEKVKEIALPPARKELNRSENIARSSGQEFSYEDRLKVLHREEVLLDKDGEQKLPTVNNMSINNDHMDIDNLQPTREFQGFTRFVEDNPHTPKYEEEVPTLLSAVKNLLEERKERNRSSSHPYSPKRQELRRSNSERNDRGSIGKPYRTNDALKNARDATMEFSRMIRENSNNRPKFQPYDRHLKRTRSYDGNTNTTPPRGFQNWNNRTSTPRSNNNSNNTTTFNRFSDQAKRPYTANPERQENRNYFQKERSNYQDQQKHGFQSQNQQATTKINNFERSFNNLSFANNRSQGNREQQQHNNFGNMISDQAKGSHRQAYNNEQNPNPFSRQRGYQYQNNINWPKTQSYQFQKGQRIYPNRNNTYNDNNEQRALPKLMKQHIQVKPDQNTTSITQHFDLDALCEYCGSNIGPHSIGNCPKRRSPRTYYYSATSSPASSNGSRRGSFYPNKRPTQ